MSKISYTLDNNGNRVSIDKNIPAAGTLPARNEIATYSRNRLASTDTALYDYDNEGQLASKQEGGTTTYSFDKAYRLTGIGSDTFAYDGAGNRLRAVRGGVETRYIYDANGNLLAEADGSNTITRYYVHGAGLLAAITPANDLYCYHYDATGNTVAITDSSETVVNSYDYSPFGMIISESEGFVQPFKYVGRLGVMSEGDFYYMRARYYDPLNGRFISEDPLGFDGGDVNLYVYVQNNPLLVVDPNGLWTFSLGVNLSGYLGAFGGVGGMNINIGYSRERGLSASLTGTAGGGAATGVGGGVGIAAMITNAQSVDDLLGTSVETSRSLGSVTATGIAGNGYQGAEMSFTLGTKNTVDPVGSAMLTSTSALIQYSDGSISLGNSGNGSIYSHHFSGK